MYNIKIVDSKQVEAIYHSWNISSSALTEKYALGVLAVFCMKHLYIFLFSLFPEELCQNSPSVVIIMYLSIKRKKERKNSSFVILCASSLHQTIFFVIQKNVMK